MKTDEMAKPQIAEGTIIIDAPQVSLTPEDEAWELLIHFYRALGWNGDDILDPRKIRTTQEVYDHLCNRMYEKHPNMVQVGMFMANSGPGVDDYIPQGKVYLLEGWVTPTPEEGECSNVA